MDTFSLTEHANAICDKNENKLTMETIFEICGCIGHRGVKVEKVDGRINNNFFFSTFFDDFICLMTNKSINKTF